MPEGLVEAITNPYFLMYLSGIVYILGVGYYFSWKLKKSREKLLNELREIRQTYHDSNKARERAS